MINEGKREREKEKRKRERERANERDPRFPARKTVFIFTRAFQILGEGPRPRPSQQPLLLWKTHHSSGVNGSGISLRKSMMSTSR